jgi:hypothetical protein
VKGLPFVAVEENDIESCLSWKYQPRSDDGSIDEARINKQAGSYKNEFGHARVNSVNRASSLFDIGGHCVVPPTALQGLIDASWVTPHPLAGANICGL